jgi:hypothetical protein
LLQEKLKELDTMKLTQLMKMAVAAATVSTLTFNAQATLDFGVSWPTGYSGSPYSDTAPYTRVLGYTTVNETTEVLIKDFINATVGPNTFSAADIHKTGQPIVENGGTDGYFTVAAGWDYLVVSYGNQGGTLLIKLDGEDAKVPYDSAAFGSTNGNQNHPPVPLGTDADKYAVSHYAVAGKHTVVVTTHGVPDGGSTVALMGLGTLGLAAIRRKK